LRGPICPEEGLQWVIVLVVLEVLNCSLVGLRFLAGGESSQISPLAVLGILLSRVQTILSGLQFSNHACFSIEVCEAVFMLPCECGSPSLPTYAEQHGLSSSLQILLAAIARIWKLQNALFSSTPEMSRASVCSMCREKNGSDPSWCRVLPFPSLKQTHFFPGAVEASLRLAALSRGLLQ